MGNVRLCVLFQFAEGFAQFGQGCEGRDMLGDGVGGRNLREPHCICCVSPSHCYQKNP